MEESQEGPAGEDSTSLYNFLSSPSSLVHSENGVRAGIMM